MTAIVSLIIPTFHRKESLIRLLNSLRNQASKDVEIIIVEQGDNNGKKFLEFARKYNLFVKYFFTKPANTSWAKNIGIKKAKGKYIIFFDDDVIVHKGTIRNLIKNFQDPIVGCVGGRILTADKPIEQNNRKVGKKLPWGAFTNGFTSTIRQQIDAPVGCIMAFTADALREVGGFDERFTAAAMREEADLALRIKNAGYQIVFDPTSVVDHKREPTGGGRKTEGRIQWYFHFLSNSTYFFLRHCNWIFFPIFLLDQANWILRCMFGFGREVSIRSFMTPFLGIVEGFRKYKEYSS